MIQHMRCVCSLLVFVNYQFPVDIVNFHGGCNPFLELFGMGCVGMAHYTALYSSRNCKDMTSQNESFPVLIP